MFIFEKMKYHKIRCSTLLKFASGRPGTHHFSPLRNWPWSSHPVWCKRYKYGKMAPFEWGDHREIMINRDKTHQIWKYQMFIHFIQIPFWFFVSEWQIWNGLASASVTQLTQLLNHSTTLWREAKRPWVISTLYPRWNCARLILKWVQCTPLDGNCYT